MEKYTKETVRSEEGSSVDRREATGSQTLAYLVYFIFGILETILVFRFVLKLLGANPSSAFVNLIYNVSQIFIWPFEGIFGKVATEGVETTAVFEPATLVAIIVYSLVAIGIAKLVRIFSGERQTE
ncbi:YggT family protein [Patescibacteria group bacterium]|nr:YggT family protein [Patescibacteria group bacterium]